MDAHGGVAKTLKSRGEGGFGGADGGAGEIVQGDGVALVPERGGDVETEEGGINGARERCEEFGGATTGGVHGRGDGFGVGVAGFARRGVGDGTPLGDDADERR